MIKIFITGGTFDKSYDHINGKLYFEKTHLPKMIKRSKCKLDIKTETILLKDSLEISENDLFKVEVHVKMKKVIKLLLLMAQTL